MNRWRRLVMIAIVAGTSVFLRPSARGQDGGSLQLHFLDVGQGHAALLRSPGGEVVLFDSGVAGECGKPLAYLQGLGLTHIDYHFVTGYGADQIGCATEILSLFPLKHAAYDRGESGVDEAGSGDASARRELGTRSLRSTDLPEYARYVAAVGAKRQTATPGMRLVLDADSPAPVRIEVVAVNGNGLPVSGEGARSLVAVIRFADFAAEIGGDLPGVMESLLAARVGPVDVYTVHDHASRDSAPAQWLSIVKPRVGIISASPGSGGGVPSAKALGRLHGAGVTTYWTSRGAVPADADHDGVAGEVLIEVAASGSLRVRQAARTESLDVRGVGPVGAATSSARTVGSQDGVRVVSTLGAAPPTHGRAADARVVVPGVLAISTWAGGFLNDFGDGVGTSAGFGRNNTTTFVITATRSGIVYVGDFDPRFGASVRRVTPDGVVSTVYGRTNSITPRSAIGNGSDGEGGAIAGLAVSLDNSTLYIADTGKCVIHRLALGSGSLTVHAGREFECDSVDGTALQARFLRPKGLAVDANGNVYVADTANHTVRLISATGVTTLAGVAGQCGFADGVGGAARFCFPVAVATDGSGTVIVADLYNRRIRKITPDRMVTTLAGTGQGGEQDGPAATAAINEPRSVAIGADGAVYFSDTCVGYYIHEGVHPDCSRNVGRRVIRRIAAAAVTTVAGSGGQVKDGIGADASFAVPISIAFDAQNVLYVLDALYVRRGTRSGIWSSPPFGSLDTPTDASTGSGEVPVTGWGLDDEGLATVEIYRSKAAGEAVAGGTRAAQTAALVFLGNATLVNGARPDIAAAYPTVPNNTRAGWGYMLLSNMLPGGGNGPFTLSAYGKDIEGQTTLLGTKTITANNAGSARPFGTLDTPGQGATVSGVHTNFGWALTPQPKTIPFDGSTIDVYIDNVPVGHPVYNQMRSDIAALFPGLNNSNGAAGAFTFDTRTLANGLHTISWVVRDSAGIAQGIGSRYFTVLN